MANLLDPALAPADVYATLAMPVQRLALATHLLYSGSWGDCAEDIRRRRAGRPYLFRLAVEVDDDLAWCHRLGTYEAARGESIVPSSVLENLR